MSEARFVSEPYKFEPILPESDCESGDGDSTDGDIGGYDVNEEKRSCQTCSDFPTCLCGCDAVICAFKVLL